MPAVPSSPRPDRPPLSRRALLAGGSAALLTGCTAPAGPAPRASSSTTASPRPTPSTSTPTPTPTPTPTIDLAADPAAIIGRSQVPVLCYHQVREWTPSDTAVDRQYVMPPATYLAQMDALADGGFSTVDPEQVLAHLTTGAPLPERPVMLTYDDSVVDGHDVALPAMQQRGFTATYYLMTVVLGKPRYLSTDQVKALDAAGMTIGAHTWDHHRVDRYAGDDWEVQIDQATQTIVDVVGHPVSTFAYPFGVFGTDAFDHLAAAGFSAAFQLDSEPLDAARPLFTLRRSIANPQWSTEDLLAKVTTTA